jgi:hypothetical protein
MYIVSLCWLDTLTAPASSATKKKKEEKKKERVRHPFTPKDCVDVMQWPQKAIP